MSKWVIGASAVVASVAILVVSSGVTLWLQQREEEKQATIAAEKPADLLERLADAPARKGKVVTVRGTVVHAEPCKVNDFGVEYSLLRLYWEGTSSVAACMFYWDKPADWFMTLEGGQKVTIRGTVADYEPNRVTLIDCELVK